MNTLILRLLLLFVGLPFALRGADSALPTKAAPAEKLFAVTITTGPTWDTAKSPAEQKFFKEHSANLARMRAESILILGGRYADKGLVIVRGADESAIRAQLAQDPSIAVGTFQAAIDEYRPFYHGDTRPPAPAPATPAKNFLIVLRLTPRLHDEKAWTDNDREIVGKHFARLQEGVARGQVLLAGRTEEPFDKTIGLIVFSAADESAARAFMEGDPCVASGIMTGTVHPYGVAVRAK